MDRDSITSENEKRICKWFEASGFEGKPLPTTGKESADWRFIKSELTLICEVKTIFSGGQVGLTRAEWERRCARERRRFEELRSKYPPSEGPLIVPDTYLKLLNGSQLYPNEPIFGEDAYFTFLEWIRDTLAKAPDVRDLPFRVTISINGLYTPHINKRGELIEWLKDRIRWAEQNHSTNRFHTQHSFKFDRKRRDSPKVHLQIRGPNPNRKLAVGFLYGGAGYNESTFWRGIRKAIGQARTSARGENTPIMIALCLESQFLHFDEVIMKTKERYDLLDWAFSEYRDLAAILLLERYPLESDTKPQEFFEWIEWILTCEWVDFGYVLTNPYQGDFEEKLRTAITTERCEFISGLKQNNSPE